MNELGSGCMSYEVMNSSIHSEFHGNPDKGRDRHFVTWSEEVPVSAIAGT